jgi:hypothetical protein
MKEAYYFPHDANARTDARILELRAEMGWEGYGLWWALVEQLREASEYKLSNNLVGGLAMGLAISKAELRKMLDLCIAVGLLVVEEDCFYSPSLRRRMAALDAKRQARADSARNAAEKRWQSAGNADAMRTHSEGTAPAMRNDATVEESTVENNKEEESKEEEPLPLVEDAASAAAPEPQKKVEEVEVVEPLPEGQINDASHTKGGAADVGTSVRKSAGSDIADTTDTKSDTMSESVKLKASRGGAKAKPAPGSVNPADYNRPEWADASFLADASEWLSRRQGRRDVKPLQAVAIQEYFTELASYTPDYCKQIFSESRKHPNWQGLTFKSTALDFAQHTQKLQQLQANAARQQQPERGAKPTGNAITGARALSQFLHSVDGSTGAAGGYQGSASQAVGPNSTVG